MPCSDAAGFDSWLSCSPAVCLWASQDTSLSFGLLICRMGLMMYLTRLL